MCKFKLTVVTLFATGVLVSLSATTANAAVANPNAQQVEKARSANYCSDPWITWGIWWVTASTRNPNGVGTSGECNPQLYNGGSWSNFDQLQQSIHDSLNAIAAGGGRITLTAVSASQLQVKTDLGGGFADTVTVAGHIIAAAAATSSPRAGGTWLAMMAPAS